MSLPDAPVSDPTPHDPDVAAGLITAVDQPDRRRRRSPRAKSVRAALVQLVIGLVAWGIAFSGAVSVGGLLVALVIAGVVLVYRGAGILGRHKVGRGFDLAAWLAGGWLLVVVVAAVLQPLLPLGESKNTALTLREPRLLPPNLFSSHPLGTNNYGLDLLARLVEGARLSLAVVLVATVVGLIVGGTIGVLAGYFRGWVDSVVGVITDVVLAFPALVLLLALASVLEPSLLMIALSLAFLTVPTYIRMARANTISIVQREFVEAARSMGAGSRRIIGSEVVPNVLPSLLSYALVSISVLIVAEASLSFLGLGIQAPTPTWGNMIAEGNGGMAERNPFIVLVPGAVLFLTVLSLNLLGEKASIRWDPLRRKS